MLTCAPQTPAANDDDRVANHPPWTAASGLDELRKTQYARLDDLGHTYLDWAAGALYAAGQVRDHLRLLNGHVFGSPNAQGPASQAATALASRTRACVLSFFNAAPDDYAVIFTANATGALRLVGEAYPFMPEGHLLLCADNHNSVNGIREFARARGAPVSCAPLEDRELRINETALRSALVLARGRGPSLFAYPAQSNFTGVQHSLAWIQEAHDQGWDVLLDAAAFVPCHRLDLSRWHPDFVALSFYKMFGYPTGVGCLLARRNKLAKLRRPAFAGGTVATASVAGDWHVTARHEAAYEDGTVNYLSLPAVEFGLRYLAGVGIDTVHARVVGLTGNLLATLQSMRHGNGAPLVRIYGPGTAVARGAIVAFNILAPDGHVVDERRVDRRAANASISLRTGLFSNPGAGEAAFAIARERLCDLARNPPANRDAYVAATGIASGGAVRVSFGLASNAADVRHLVAFVASFRDPAPGSARLPPRV